jgi:hypothetical protein
MKLYLIFSQLLFLLFHGGTGLVILEGCFRFTQPSEESVECTFVLVPLLEAIFQSVTNVLQTGHVLFKVISVSRVEKFNYFRIISSILTFTLNWPDRVPELLSCAESTAPISSPDATERRPNWLGFPPWPQSAPGSWRSAISVRVCFRRSLVMERVIKSHPLDYQID